MTTTVFDSQSTFRHTTGSSVFEQAWSTIRVYRQRARQRAQLREMSPHMLADIGVNVAQACAESRKPFWVA